MSHVLIKRADGGVSIMTLTQESVSVEVEIEKYKAYHFGMYVAHRELLHEHIPRDGSAQEQWEYTESGPLKVRSL